MAWWLGSKVKRAQHSARWRISSPAGEASNRAFERGASDSLAGYSGDGVPAPFLFVGKKNSDSVMSGIGFLERSGLGSNSALTVRTLEKTQEPDCVSPSCQCMYLGWR